ncbi:MAG: hypothetical protein DHS20C20_20810 [Ardenticatenaceae bacterium]|nr:MAG: hypothetical protein DHS20C20_20810 [Ardenticatenaceae bacterium]
MWIIVGLLNFVALFVPASLLIDVFVDRTVEPFGSQAAFTLLMILTLALVVSTSLLYLGLSLYQKWQQALMAEGDGSEILQQHLRKTAVLLLSLGFLLFMKALHNLYWFMIWDSTVDSLDYMWLVVPILALSFWGPILFHISSGKTRQGVLIIYSLLLPLLLIGITANVQRVDFRQLTETRAEQVSDAIENYYGRYGRYPQNLNQLTPRYILSLSEPIIIYGQTWCYEGADDYFRLGYVSREHWSNPRLSGHLHKIAGDPPALQPLCQDEVAAMQARYPDYPYEYWTANE